MASCFQSTLMAVSFSLPPAIRLLANEKQRMSGRVGHGVVAVRSDFSLTQGSPVSSHLGVALVDDRLGVVPFWAPQVRADRDLVEIRQSAASASVEDIGIDGGAARSSSQPPGFGRSPQRSPRSGWRVDQLTLPEERVHRAAYP